MQKPLCRGILRKYGQNNNSPATGPATLGSQSHRAEWSVKALWQPSCALTSAQFHFTVMLRNASGRVGVPKPKLFLSKLEGKRPTGEFLKDREWRAVRRDKRILRNQKCLLEGELAGKHSVAHTVGEGNPAGVGGKLPSLLWRILLETLVLFHQVVATVHEFVVRRAKRTGKMQDTSDVPQAARKSSKR